MIILRYEIDYRNGIVDIFVQKDDLCPVPYMNKVRNEAHEGLCFRDFMDMVDNIKKDIVMHAKLSPS